MALCARTQARFLKNFVFPVLFGHNYSPQKQKKPHQNFFCRLRKSTSICAIDLALQHIYLMIHALFQRKNWCFLIVKCSTVHRLCVLSLVWGWWDLILMRQKKPGAVRWTCNAQPIILRSTRTLSFFCEHCHQTSLLQLHALQNNPKGSRTFYTK